MCRGIEETRGCSCGCENRPIPEREYDRQLAQLRADIASMTRLVTSAHLMELRSTDSVLRVVPATLAELAELIMNKADLKSCRTKAEVLAMTTACLLEIARQIEDMWHEIVPAEVDTLEEGASKKSSALAE